jgi:hypothetical protein
MSFSTITTFQYILPCKELSYELERLVSKYLKKHGVMDAIVDHRDNDTDRSLMITSNKSIDQSMLDMVECEIPSMVKEIDDCEKLRMKNDLDKVRKFLKGYVLPRIGNHHKKELSIFLDVIVYRFNRIKKDFANGVGNVCYVGDVESWTEMFNCIKKGEYHKAMKVYRGLDTGEREETPECITELFNV